VSGDTAIVAGAPLLFSGVRPGLDGVPYLIDTATHDYSKSAGFLTKISGKLYDGKSGGGSGSGHGSGDGADASGGSRAGGTVAPNSSAGTPATPSRWSIEPRTSGITGAN
jgi:hypothetical protein